MGRNRSFVTESSLPARCSPEAVMDVLLDASARPRWQPEIVSTQGPSRLAAGDRVEGRARMLGFAVDGRGDAVAVGEHHFEEDVIVGVRMRVHYQVRPTPEGCVVSHRLESVLPQGVMGGVLSFFLRARLKRMQRVAVERLVAQSEVLLP